MKNYQLIVSLLVLSLSITACQSKDKFEPTDFKLNLEFESTEDLNWVTIPSDMENQDKEIFMVDGTLHMSGENRLHGLGMKYKLEPGLLVHYRTRSSAAGPCYRAGVGFSSEQTQSKGIGLGGCPDAIHDAEAVFNRDHYGDSIFAKLPIRGSVPVIADEWVDRIFWIPSEGDQLYYLASNTNDPEHITYGAVTLPEDWQTTRWDTDVSAFFDAEGGDLVSQYVDIDFVRIADGPLSDYLYYNLPAYLENREDIDQFLGETPEPMPELEPMS
ncbi:MAG: hypothetical protein JXJ17_14020 [Anaerolineae bacterium]|nr:hypothetical protein [Anaerolineae bacterium]